jgi:hypothetical protein
MASWNHWPAGDTGCQDARWRQNLTTYSVESFSQLELISLKEKKMTKASRPSR